MAKNAYGPKLNTPVGRVSYPHVFQRAQGMNGKPGKYELTLLIPKSVDISALKNAVDAVGKEAFGAAWVNISKKKPCIKDGDAYADEKAAEGKSAEECRGMWIIRPRTANKIPVVDRDPKVFLEEEQFYGGCWARCNVTPGSYDADGSKGVTLYLNSVQKAKDGERFGNAGVDPEAVFEAFEEEAGGVEDNF